MVLKAQQRQVRMPWKGKTNNGSKSLCTVALGGCPKKCNICSFGTWLPPASNGRDYYHEVGCNKSNEVIFRYRWTVCTILNLIKNAGPILLPSPSKSAINVLYPYHRRVCQSHASSAVHPWFHCQRANDLAYVTDRIAVRVYVYSLLIFGAMTTGPIVDAGRAAGAWFVVLVFAAARTHRW